MITILGVSLAWETIGMVALFAASEIVAATPLKANSIAQLFRGLVENLKPTRTEDEKVMAVKEATMQLQKALKQIGK